MENVLRGTKFGSNDEDNLIQDGLLNSAVGEKTKKTKAFLEKSVVNDVVITLDVLLGDTKMKVSELMALEVGSTIELDASLNQKAALQLNGNVIGHGEIVAVGDKFGIRITEIGD